MAKSICDISYLIEAISYFVFIFFVELFKLQSDKLIGKFEIGKKKIITNGLDISRVLIMVKAWRYPLTL